MATPKWALKDIHQLLTDTGYKITIWTFQPCHLWMRWTTTDPQEHMIPVIRRGLAIYSDKRFCFVNYHDNEQEEGDDTYIHTFLKEPWPSCETRYFYFHGRMGGERSPSTSAIFTKHRLAPPAPPIQRYEYNEWDGLATGYAQRSDAGVDGRGFGYSEDFFANSTHPINHIVSLVRQYSASHPPCGINVRLYNYDLDPIITPPILTEGFVPASDIPPYPTWLWIRLNVPLVTLNEGTHYIWCFFNHEEGAPSRRNSMAYGKNLNYVGDYYLRRYNKADLSVYSSAGGRYLLFENWTK